MFSNYGALSTEVYKLTKPTGVSVNGDIQYYASRLKDTSGRILEAGVGTGRMLIPLLEAGHEVDGVDYSAEMLEECKAECKKNNFNPPLYNQNLVDLNLDAKYDTIIMPTGSFCLIDTKDSAIKVLQNFYSHLNIGGKIIIDLEMPYDFVEGKVENSVFKISETTGIRMEYISLELDWICQQTKSIIKYEKWNNGQLIGSELQNFVLAWYGVKEFEMILRDLGFANIVSSSNYKHDEKPNANTKMITFEATRLE